LIPGIIAFAVDFNNGTIYLPGGVLSQSSDPNDIKVVKFDPKHSSLAGIERIIQKETGCIVKLDQPDMRITKLRSKDEISAQFAKVLPKALDGRMALLQ
jgi:hypothetical protein